MVVGVTNTHRVGIISSVPLFGLGENTDRPLSCQGVETEHVQP